MRDAYAYGRHQRDALKRQRAREARAAHTEHEADGYVRFGTGCTHKGCDATIVLVEGTFDDCTVEWSE